MDVNTQRAMLEETERLAGKDAEYEKLLELCEPPEELDADKAERMASQILHQLGFAPAMQCKELRLQWGLEDEGCHRQSPLH